MGKKIAIGVLVFFIIIIGGGLYVGHVTGLIDLGIRTLENTANGCDQYRNKCGFINIIISEGSIEKQRVDGSFFQIATVHVEPKSATGCLITEFPDVCIDELDFDLNRYGVKQFDIERRLVTVFERDSPIRSNSASLEDEKAECRLVKPASQCQTFEDIFCTPEFGCAIP